MSFQIFGFTVSNKLWFYFIQIFVSQLLFVRTFEKRKFFALRMAFGFLAVLCLALFVKFSFTDKLEAFFSFFIFIALSTIIMLACYKEKVGTIISACAAGVAVQHIAGKLQGICELLFDTRKLAPNSLVYYLVFDTLFCAVTMVAAYFIFARPVAKNKTYKYGDKRLSIISVVIVLTCIGINRFTSDPNAGSDIKLATNMYAILCCVFALVIQFNLSRWNKDRTELQLTHRLLKDEKKQYEQWKNSIDLINIRYHDIRHMLSDIKQLVEAKGIDLPNLKVIEKAVGDYTTQSKTGNEVLDVLFENMSEICRLSNIQLSCVSSTDALKNADGMELYSLFNNAIDNAIHSVKKIDNSEKRIIDVSIKEFGDSVIIHIWNYFVGSIKFSDGMPVVEDGDEAHGYGMKSMKMVVERAGGTMRASIVGEVFNLDIILPVVK